MLQRAGETYMNVGDYAAALAMAEKLIRKRPDLSPSLLLEARALSALHRHEEALATYVVAARLIGEPKRVRADVFTRMSDEFEAMGRFCEAMTPIETYIAAEPELRNAPVLEARIEEDRRKGNCAAAQAGGIEVLHRLATGPVRTRATVNGVEGDFLVDTGASFVSVSPEFAKRAKLSVDNNAGLKQFLTANGAVDAPVITLGSVRLGTADGHDGAGRRPSQACGSRAWTAFSECPSSRFRHVFHPDRMADQAKALGKLDPPRVPTRGR